MRLAPLLLIALLVFAPVAASETASVGVLETHRDCEGFHETYDWNGSVEDAWGGGRDQTCSTREDLVIVRVDGETVVAAGYGERFEGSQWAWWQGWRVHEDGREGHESEWANQGRTTRGAHAFVAGEQATVDTHRCEGEWRETSYKSPDGISTSYHVAEKCERGLFIHGGGVDHDETLSECDPSARDDSEASGSYSRRGWENRTSASRTCWVERSVEIGDALVRLRFEESHYKHCWGRQQHDGERVVTCDAANGSWTTVSVRVVAAGQDVAHGESAPVEIGLLP